MTPDAGAAPTDAAMAAAADAAAGPAGVLTQGEWLDRIQHANGDEGNYLAAYDLSVQALDAWAGAMVFEHQAILALARAGALNRALERYARLENSGCLHDLADQDLAAEFAGLYGRLLKDRAAGSAPEEAGQHQLDSATAYANAFQHLGKYYLAINAASMYLACGRVQQAHEYARHALQLAAAQSPADYWSNVTQAEASLILGEHTAAAEMLRAAAADRLRTLAASGTENLDEVASTRRQLTWVAGLVGAPLEILDNLPKPRILNWVSLPDLPLSAIAFEFSPEQTVIAFGSLMSQADLEIAEALLDARAKVHLVLPCEAGLLASRIFFDKPGLAQKFERVLSDKKNVRTMLVTREGCEHEPAADLLCQQQARGLALLRGQSLAVTPELFVPGAQGVTFSAIPYGNVDIRETPPSVDAQAGTIRKPHAIIFGDVHGFSALTEAEQLVFLEHIIGGFASALEESASVEYAETAGDGLFIVLSDVLSAIECCFRLREVLLSESVARAGLPSHLGIRLSAHVGPLYRRYDKVIRRYKFVGMEVIRTARIEPVTPVGEIFVTEQFAASLAFTARGTYVCEYAGLQPMAKSFGECRMYSLRHAKNAHD